MSDIERFDVFLVALDPTRGSEISKTRPCAVVSPDEMNRHVRAVIVAPMTTASRAYPTRVAVRFQGKGGRIALDQIRTWTKPGCCGGWAGCPRGLRMRLHAPSFRCFGRIDGASSSAA